MGGGWLCPEGQEAVAEISGSGEGWGAWESTARGGEEGAAGSERGVQRQEDKRCIESRLLLPFSPVQLCPSPAGSWGGTRPLTPLLPAAPGAPAQSLAALNAPCVVCARQMLHPCCCQSPGGCDPAAAPTQSPAPQKHPPRAGDVLGGGDVPVLGGCGSPPSPAVHRTRVLRAVSCAHPGFLLLCCVPGLRTDPEVASPAHCVTVTPFAAEANAPRRDEGDFQGCSRAWGW